MKIKRSLCLFLSCIFLLSASAAAADHATKKTDTVSVFAHKDTMQVDIEQVSEMPDPERLPPDPDKPYIALTFDDGPNYLTTPKVLDALDKYGARATFFVLGQRINNKTSDLLVRMIESGSEIGNHSYDHPILSNLTKSGIRDQINRTETLVYNACGQKPTLIRPPYGSVNSRVLETISQPAVLWSVDTLDWESRNTKKIVAKVLDNVESGDIILMHDIYASTANAVEPILKILSEQGYQFVTVSELLELRGDTVEAGKKYY